MTDTPKPKTVDEVIAAALKENQSVSLQDTDHGSLAVRDGVAALIPSLAKNGVKHLFVEKPIPTGGIKWFVTNIQDIFDGYSEGKVSDAEAEEYFKNNLHAAPKQWVKILAACKQHGIRIWASDPGSSIVHTTSLMVRHWDSMMYMFEVDRVSQRYPDPCERARHQPQIKDAEIARALYLEAMPKKYEARSAINEEVVNFALEKAKDKDGKPEKLAYFWGGGHSNNTVGSQDIDELSALLDHEKGTKVTNIAIYASKAAKICIDAFPSSSLITTKGKDSDFNYFTTEKEIALNQEHSETPHYKDIDTMRKANEALFKKSAPRSK